MPTEKYGDFHFPDKLKRDWEWKEKFPKCVKWVKDGMPPKDAVCAIFGIAERTYNKWLHMYEEDVAAGFDANDSRLIQLFDELRMTNGELHLRLASKGVDLALDGNVEMTKFLLERRFNYKKPTKDIEVGTKEDTTFNINIVDSKPVDE